MYSRPPRTSTAHTGPVAPRRAECPGRTLDVLGSPAFSCPVDHRKQHGHGLSRPGWRRARHRTAQSCAALPDNGGVGYDDSDFCRAHVHEVRLGAPGGPIILLRFPDEGNLMVPVFVGASEAGALLAEIQQHQRKRPLSHDLFKNSLDVLGYKVLLVRIHALIDNTYHARLHVQRADGTGVSYDIDSRPSDAINLAVRFAAPVLFKRSIVKEMGKTHVNHATDSHIHETQAEIERTCLQECSLHEDPTVMYNLQLQVAVQEERYEEASRLRDKIDDIIHKDRTLKLVVAIQTALEDKRYQEAARLRDELRELKLRSYHYPQGNTP